MTIVGYFVASMCLLLGLGAGVFTGYRRALKPWKNDVLRLEGSAQAAAKALGAAQIDVEIVRALREGTIGVEDLHEVGFENIQLQATGALKAIEPEAPSEETGEYMPFVKLPYERACTKIEQMVPGDEVWISMTNVHHDTSGRVRLWRTTACSPTATENNRCRLRFYDQKHELGVDPTDPIPASSLVTNANWWMDHVVVLRPEDRWSRPALRSRVEIS